MSEPKTTALIEVTLAKPHTHADVPRKVGDKIQVTEPERDWLVANRVIDTSATKEASKK